MAFARSLWRSVYFNRVFQFVVLLLVALILIVAYVVFHHEQSPLGWRYKRDIHEIAERSFDGFRLRLSADRSTILFTQDGRPLASPDDVKVAPFGLERSASFRALIERHINLAELINADYAERRDAWRGLFEERAGYASARVAAFLEEATEPPREFRFPRAVITALGEKRGPAFEAALMETLRRRAVFTVKALPAAPPKRTADLASGTLLARPDDAATANGNGDAPPNVPTRSGARLQPAMAVGVADTAAAPAPAPEPLSGGGARLAPTEKPLVLRLNDAKIDDISERLAREEQRIDHQSPDVELVALTAPEGQQLARSFARRDRQLWATLVADQTAPTESQALSALLQKLNTQLKTDLIAVAYTETRPLWVAGRLRWVELVCWVWFGVLTFALIDHGGYLAGKRPGEIWQPGEILRTFSKFFYAPVLAITLFFLAHFMGASAEAGELDRNTVVSLGIAFVLGLFPTSAFRIIQEFSTKIFREDLRGGKDPKAVPARASVAVDATHRESAQRAPYTLAQLMNNVGHITTAPIDRPSSS